jgi:hypothetical protein
MMKRKRRNVARGVELINMHEVGDQKVPVVAANNVG